MLRKSPHPETAREVSALLEWLVILCRLDQERSHLTNDMSTFPREKKERTKYNRRACCVSLVMRITKTSSQKVDLQEPIKLFHVIGFLSSPELVVSLCSQRSSTS